MQASDISVFVDCRVRCPNPKCRQINELNLIVILMSPSPDALVTSKCNDCHEDFAVRWTTSQPERIKPFLAELMTYQQQGEALIRKHLSNFDFGVVALSAKLPNEWKKDSWLAVIRRKLGRRRRRTGGG